jgi:hypothetical protein
MSEESRAGLGAVEIDDTTVNIHTGATASEQTITTSTDNDSTIAAGILTNSNTDNINIGHVNNNGPTATLNNGPTVNYNGFANRASTGTTTADATLTMALTMAMQTSRLQERFLLFQQWQCQ